MNQFPYVPYGTTVHGEDEIAAVTHVLRTTTQMSKHVRELEEKVAVLYNKNMALESTLALAHFTWLPIY